MDSTSDNNLNQSTANPVNWGFALVAAFALGLALGFFGRPSIIDDAPIQVVVTVVPDSNQAVAQSTETDSQATTDSTAAAQSSPPTTGNNAFPASQSTPPVDAAAASPAEPTPTLMEFIMADARHVQGDENAPITIVEFSDFKWPYCGRFAVDSLSRIREEYIETGRVRFVYKHFAILGPESARAAEASECAAEQDKFWAYHDLVFGDQTTVGSTLNQERLVSLAEELGLSTDTFRECLSSGKYSLQIAQESQSVQALGVRGTPGFLVNGLYIAGAQPFEVFQQVIEEQLAAN